MIGVITTFYGYKGRKLVSKVKELIRVFECVNLPPYIQLQSSPEGEVFEDVIFELNELKEKHGAEYSIHNSMWFPTPNFNLNLGSSNLKIKESNLQALKKSIDFAERIGAKKVSFHSGFAANIVKQEKEFKPLKPLDIISYQEAYSNVEENLKDLLEYAGGKIKLSIENLNYRPKNKYLFPYPKDYQRLPKEIGLLFDTGHAYFSQKETKDPSYIEKMIEIMGGKITEIHASDNDGTEDQHKLVGFGSIPFLNIFRQISKKQELPPIIIEARQEEHNYSNEDLKRSIKNLHKLILLEK